MRVSVCACVLILLFSFHFLAHREDYKRIAEETTLLMVQQLIEHRLETRPDVPAHYRAVCDDMIRAALPARPPAYNPQPQQPQQQQHQHQQHQHQHQRSPLPQSAPPSFDRYGGGGGRDPRGGGRGRR